MADFAYVVYVHAGPENYKRRENIRTTWAQPNLLKDYPSKLVFFMGLPKDESLVNRIKQENDKYGDIVMEDYIDGYKNLTYKAISAFKWFTVYCQNVKYLLKVDDDIFVNIFRLMTTLTTKFDKTERFFYCALWLAHSMPILRNPKNCAKWCVPKDFLPGKNDYPQYCSGSAYFFTQDVTADLYNASLYTPYFFIDDAYATGLLPPKVSNEIKFYSAGHGTYKFNLNLMKYIKDKNVSNKTIVIHTSQYFKQLWHITIKELTENEQNMMTTEKYAEIKQNIIL
jgi:beta-1,3-galactosyltransferase 1